MISAMSQVSELQPANDALGQGEERFRVAFEEGPLGVFMLGSDDRFVQVNHAFCRLLGYRIEELDHKTELELTHPDDLEASLSLGRAMQQGRDRQAIEKRYIRKDGHILWVRVSLGWVCTREGRLLYRQGVVEDVSQRRRAEEALRRAERLASVGTLAAGIAHEINNPLGAIVLSADAALLALDQPAARGILEASLNNIQASALRCGRIVKSVLQFARDEVSQKWPSSILDVIRHARDMTRKLAAEQGVTLDLELDETCPELVMNPTEMEQVLTNLISNGIQASRPGGTVRVRAVLDGGGLQITVQDHGRGMSAEQIAHMFDPFYTTRVQEGGTGLGLSITHGIVHEHGGTIEVDSAAGEGTTISVRFPASLCK